MLISDPTITKAIEAIDRIMNCTPNDKASAIKTLSEIFKTIKEDEQTNFNEHLRMRDADGVNKVKQILHTESVLTKLKAKNKKKKSKETILDEGIDEALTVLLPHFPVDPAEKKAIETAVEHMIHLLPGGEVAEEILTNPNVEAGCTNFCHWLWRKR